jgi:hypothetical protein
MNPPRIGATRRRPLQNGVMSEPDTASSVRPRVLPTRWVPDLSRLLPADPATFHGPRLATWLLAAYLLLVAVRSVIHLFAPDGGAGSIASVDLSVEGADNIVAMFGQWGAIQLLLALVMIVLVARYRGLVPLMALALAVEPVLRFVSATLKPLETLGTAPGAALNEYAGLVMLAVLYLALCPARPAR